MNTIFSNKDGAKMLLVAFHSGQLASDPTFIALLLKQQLQDGCMHVPYILFLKKPLEI
jgi:hypothetical protein